MHKRYALFYSKNYWHLLKGVVYYYQGKGNDQESKPMGWRVSLDPENSRLSNESILQKSLERKASPMADVSEQQFSEGMSHTSGSFLRQDFWEGFSGSIKAVRLRRPLPIYKTIGFQSLKGQKCCGPQSSQNDMRYFYTLFTVTDIPEILMKGIVPME